MKTRHVIIAALLSILIGAAWGGIQNVRAADNGIYEHEDANRREIPDMSGAPEYIEVNIEGAAYAELEGPSDLGLMCEIRDEEDLAFLMELGSGTYELVGRCFGHPNTGSSNINVEFYDSAGEKLFGYAIDGNRGSVGFLQNNATYKRYGEVPLFRDELQELMDRSADTWEKGHWRK